jgi:hypothetical protein
MRTRHPARRLVPQKYVLQIPLTDEELAELEEFYGAGHGLATRVRADIFALTRARQARKAKFVAGVKVTPTTPQGRPNFIKEMLERYGKDDEAATPQDIGEPERQGDHPEYPELP